MLHLIALVIALAPSGNLGLLQTALNPNPTLHSYIATAELVARSHPLPLKRTFLGTAYYVAPVRTLVFDNVSGLLSRFQSLTTNTPTWAQAERDYTIAPASDDGTTSTFTLVPTKSGARVTSIVVLVDDAAALVSRAVYHYADGSVLSFDQRYQTVGAFHVPASIDISAHFPGYSVEGTIRFSNYRTNVSVPANLVPRP
jgi:hypothetical protein